MQRRGLQCGYRNNIELRNAMFRNAPYLVTGDVTTHLKRRWSAQMLYAATAAVRVNLAMFDSAAWSRPHTDHKPTPLPSRVGREPDVDNTEQWELGDNAPSKAT